MLFLIGYMFIPMTVALVLQRIVYRQPLALLGVRWRVNRWFIVGWLCPVFLSLASLGASCLVPGVRFSPPSAVVGHTSSPRRGRPRRPPTTRACRTQKNALRGLPPWAFISLALAAGLVAGVTINAVAAFGEELGWRGFLPRYMRDMGFWRLSYLVGFIWGVWHVPVILQGVNYLSHPATGSLLMIAQMMLLSPLLMYVRMRARSVIAAAVMHGSINGTFGVSTLFLVGGNDLTTGAMGLPGLAAARRPQLADVHKRRR